MDNTTKLIKLESINKYEKINLDDINILINRIYNEITEGDNIVDIGNNNEIYFKDLLNFLNDIRNGKINDFNKEMEYEKRLKDTEIKLEHRKEFSDYTRLYERYVNILERELFTPKKLCIPTKTPQSTIKLDEFRNQKGSSTLTYQSKFVKLLLKITLKNINQILKELYN